MYANPRRSSLSDYPDPYAGDGLMYRIWNYRHQVTHRRANPYFIRLTLGADRSPRRGFSFWTGRGRRLHEGGNTEDRSGHFVLDPRDDPPVGATKTVHQDVDGMFTLVEERLEAALTLL